MNKRTFIRLSSTLMASPLLKPLAALAKEEPLKNWAGNLTYSTRNVSYPRSVEEVQKLVKKTARLKVLGTRHCFNTIADSKDYLLGIKNLNKIIQLDTKAHTVTVEAGIKYGELCPYLDEHGYALHNLASLPHISVAGACATATHGSGVSNSNLAAAVRAMEIVDANGELHKLKREDGETFNAAVVGLGALGVVTKITLDLQPAFKVRQYVFQNMPVSQLKEHFNAIVSAGYSVSLFTDWQSDYINEVWVKNLEKGATDFSSLKEFYGGRAATRNLHPISELPAENCTEQMGVAGNWYERLPHFKMGFTPSSGVELQSEYFVPGPNAMDAIMAVSRLNKQVGPHLLISEIRTIAADDLWMSPCYKQACVSIHFTWKQDWPAVSKLLPIIEKELSPYNARPHWGKLFSVSPEALQKLYVKLPEFKKIAGQFDPKGKFRNEFLIRNI